MRTREEIRECSEKLNYLEHIENKIERIKSGVRKVKIYSEKQVWLKEKYVGEEGLESIEKGLIMTLEREKERLKLELRLKE